MVDEHGPGEHSLRRVLLHLATGVGQSRPGMIIIAFVLHILTLDVTHQVVSKIHDNPFDVVAKQFSNKLPGIHSATRHSSLFYITLVLSSPPRLGNHSRQLIDLSLRPSECPELLNRHISPQSCEIPKASSSRFDILVNFDSVELYTV